MFREFVRILFLTEKPELSVGLTLEQEMAR